MDDDDTQVYKDDGNALLIAYQSGYYDGKKAAQRPWVELTKGEIESWDLPDNLTRVEFAWFVETKLREKNT